jgi:long-chain fatty acid transport protein
MPNSTVSSSIEHPVYGTLAEGSTNGQAGAIPAPSMALVWRRCPKSRVTYGFSLSAVGGAATLYPADADGTPLNERNLILAGVSKSSTVVVLQVTPTVSYKLSDRLSVGFAPIVDIAGLTVNPMQLGQPLGTEVHNYGTRYAWGGGFQMGAYYDFKNHFKTGFMFKSPIWAESLMFHGTDTHENVVSGAFNLNLPMTLSAGVSYDGFKNTVLALDVRYFDYAHTNGFRKGLNPATGVVEGLDWNSVVSIAMGVERTLSKKLKVRAGYCWNENPIPSRSSFLNVAAPLTLEHAVSLGATYAIAKDFEINLAYSHSFWAKTSGDFPIAPNQLFLVGGLGHVTNASEADLIVAGFTKRW